MAKIARPEIEIEELTGEGSGILKKNALLYGKELGEHCRMYTQVVMPEGSDLEVQAMLQSLNWKTHLSRQMQMQVC